MGHFDILLFQTPQDLLETALGAGAFWAKTDPFTASVGPEGAWYQVKVCGDHVSNPGGPIGGSQDQIWSPGVLCGPSGLDTWSTHFDLVSGTFWAHRGRKRVHFGSKCASSEGSLEKILRGLEQLNIKMSHKIGSRNDPENQF